MGVRRGFFKYLVLIPTIWFIAILTFSFRNDSSSLSPSNNHIPINVVNRIISAPSLVDRIRNVLPFQQHIDHDHPHEERVKAREQEKRMNAKIQVVAPEINHRNSSGPGELGNPVRIKKDTLTQEERHKYDDGWKNHAFNEYASNMISWRRSLADVRDPECKKVEFLSNLSDTSVIIIFHNEARSTLLRTIWSVIDRSPAQLLKEIILVDDFSDKGLCLW